MKKKAFISIILVLAMMAGMMMPVYSANEATTAETAPVLNIEAKNVAFMDSVYMMFLVSHENAAASDVKLLVWTDAPDGLAYEYGTQTYTLSYTDSQTYNGKDCARFIYSRLKAKELADNFYFRAYTKVDGTAYYSDVLKYSVVQYNEDIQNKSTNENLKNILTQMLEYGAAVQTYGGYHTDRLASAAFHEVRVEGGTLADGTASGLYVSGERITMTAPAAIGSIPFSCWKNSAGTVVGTTVTSTVTAGDADETYTAYYSAAGTQLAAIDEPALAEEESVLLSGISAVSEAVPAVTSAQAAVLNIEAKNVAFMDSVYMMFLVSHENVAASDVKLLVWNDAPDGLAYEYGTQAYTLSYSDSQTYNGKDCARFIYNRLKAKELADNFYFRAYTEIDGTVYYSDVLKYSVAQYNEDIQKKSTDENLKNVLTQMLEYGAAVQVYGGYHTDRLASAEFHEVHIEGGTLSDGTTAGIYVNGESITAAAPATDGNAMPFEAWQNSAGTVVGTDLTLSATAGNADQTYTAVYNYDFIYTDLGNGTYSIKAADITALPAEIVIPETYNGGKVVKIDPNAFANCTGLTSVYISSNITAIGANAFAGCTGLTTVTFAEETGWIANNVSLPTNHIANSIKVLKYLTETYVAYTWVCDPDNFDGDYTIPY